MAPDDFQTNPPQPADLPPPVRASGIPGVPPSAAERTTAASVAGTVSTATWPGRWRRWLGQLPRSARLSARREFVAAIPLALLSSSLSGPFCGFVGRKALAMGDGLYTALMACNFTGLFLAGVLIGLLQHRPKIRLLVGLLYAVAAVLLSIAALGLLPLAPLTDSILFIAHVLIAQVLMSLFVTVRPTIWRANYPVAHRAKLVMLITFSMTVLSALLLTAVTNLMDRFDWSFRVLYGLAGGCALLAAVLFGRLRIRRENATLARARRDAPGAPRLLAGLHVLRDDRDFRNYMAWQMLNGLSTLSVGVAHVVIVNDVFECSWLAGGLVLTAIPTLVAAASGLGWARVFDRTDVFTMRTYGALLWIAARVLLLVGVLTLRFEWIVACSVAGGLAMGLGHLVWRLGHMHFAPPEKDALYMGVHTSLTGVRGILAPLLGMGLYHWNVLGPHGVALLLVTCTAQLLSAVGFYRMGRARLSCS